MNKAKARKAPRRVKLGCLESTRVSNTPSAEITPTSLDAFNEKHSWKCGNQIYPDKISPSSPIDRLGKPKHCQLNDLNACINVDLIAEELASIDRKGCKYMNAYHGVYRKLQEGLEFLSLDDSCCVMFSLPVFS